jgi:hypothetical protein
VRGSNELVPAFERRSGLGVVSPKANKRIPSNTRTLLYDMFPRWEHKLGIRRIRAPPIASAEVRSRLNKKAGNDER